MKKAEPDGEEKVESSENLLQLLSLLAALQEEEDEEDLIPTRPTPPRQPPTGPVQFPSRPISQRPRPTPVRPARPRPTSPRPRPTPPRQPPQRPTRQPFIQRPTPSRVPPQQPAGEPFPWQTTGPLFQETLLPSPPGDNLPSRPGPPYLPSSLPFPPQPPARPVRRPGSGPIRQPASSQSLPSLPSPIPPLSTQGQTLPPNLPPLGETNSGLLDQMLSDLLGTTVARPSQPPRPVRRPTVDVVIGGVPRPTNNDPTRPGRPSLASPGRYPIRLPPPPSQNSAFSLPSDSIRPQRQIDVSTVRAALGEARSRAESVTEESNKVSYYPQLSSWNDQVTGDEDYASSVDVSNEMPLGNPFSSEKSPKRTAEVPTDEYNDIGQTVSSSLKTGSSNRDNMEFQTLVAQLNSTLEQLKRQEEEKRRNKRRGTQKPTVKEAIEEEGPELIYVNIWNNVGGKLKLTGQKPMLKESFDEMQSKKDFSSLLSPSPPSYFPEPSWQSDSNYHLGATGNHHQHRYPLFEELRQSGNIEARHPLPSSPQPLRSPTPENLWSDGTSPALGVGTNYARPSYKDGQNSQGFLQDLEQSFRQSSFTQKPPNFTPIPLPQVPLSLFAWLYLSSLPRPCGQATWQDSPCPPWCRPPPRLLRSFSRSVL